MFMEILEILVPILCAVFVGLSCYFRVKGNLTVAVAELIATAEASGLTGPEKMDQVVSGLYAMVPAALKKVLNERQLKEIAQFIFDWMRKYALLYMEAQKKDKSMDEEKLDEQTDIVIAEATTALVIELLDLTEAALKEKALSYGVKLEGLETKEDVIKAIIHSALV